MQQVTERLLSFQRGTLKVGWTCFSRKSGEEKLTKRVRRAIQGLGSLSLLA
jgi:hypothetical protein